MDRILVWIELGSIAALSLICSCCIAFSDRSPVESETYIDEDGEGTKESIRRFHRTLPRNVQSNAAALGLVVAITKATFTVVDSHEHDVAAWLRIGSWSMLLAQSFITRLNRSPMRQYTLGAFPFVSSTLLVIFPVRDRLVCWLDPHQARYTGTFYDAFYAMELFFALVIASSWLCSPRRPNVYWKGQPVDKESTCSLIARYSFSWASPLLALGKEQSLINFSDLAGMSHGLRAQNLELRLRSLYRGSGLSIFLVLLRAHSSIILWQWFLTAVQSVVAYGPQLVMYKFLRVLETQQVKPVGDPELWLWALAIGAIRLFQTFLEVNLAWISFARLAISIRSQLSAAIFSKCMRMSITRSGRPENQVNETKVFETELKDTEEDRLISPDGDADFESIPLKKISEDRSSQASSRPPIVGTQDTVNLIAVDAQRISDFCSYNNIFVSVTITFIIAVVVLIKLIGWLSLMAGLTASLLLMPANTWASKYYNQAQIDLMKTRDEKAELLTSVVQGLRQIKYSATEDQWQDRIMVIRRCELVYQRRIFMWALVLRFCWIASPIFLSMAALSTYAWLNGSFSASLAFTSLAIFGNLEWCLSVVPLFIAQFFDAKVSGGRIMNLLGSYESESQIKGGENVELRDTVIRWPGNNSFCLFVNVVFPAGQLTLIHGASGSGKSLLLSAIFGEANIDRGEIIMPKSKLPTPAEWLMTGAIAFVAQTPWLENVTIKQNILFGLPYRAERYHESIKASALTADLEILPDGDMTEIGARGVNLSGGQRMRVSLARAFYSRASILVLDDIFGSVDSHIALYIHKHGLMGPICRGRTRILATHHINLCHHSAACVTYLKNGVATSEEKSPLEGDNLLPPREGFEEKDAASAVGIQGQVQQNEESINEITQNSDLPAQKFVADETRELGGVRWAIYRTYLRASGGFRLWMPALIAISASQLALLFRGWWMKLWTESTDSATSSPSNRLQFFLIMYVLISFAAALLEILKCFLVYTGGLQASQKLFSDLIYRVLRAQMRWIDTVPLGRIMNRFTADFNAVDSKVPAENHALLSAIMSLVCIFIAGLALSPYMTIPYVVLLGISIYFTLRYVGSAREIRRLEATARSPILDLFGNSMLGLDTIRAFGKVQDYTSRMFDHIDDWSKSTWAFWLVTQWMSFRMGLIGTFFVSSVAVAIVMLRHVDASLAGFVFLLALNFSKALEDAIKRSAAFQFNMNSIERIVEFTDMETEAPGGNRPPVSWPSHGRIIVENLEVGYAPKLPPVLHDITITVEPCERIGVVGRTGAGKSSLTLALFRFLEARSGRIKIDGVDIAQMKLKNLRSKMTLIPQDPVLNSGSVRESLDPFGQYTDEELHESLKRAHLTTNPADGLEMINSSSTDVSPKRRPSSRTTHNMFTDLTSHISTGGQNLSQGQRQLMCLARASLTQSKIVVLDEATSAVDMATDELIQKSIRKHFSQSTMVVIAHRLRTVADFDKILVMSEGRVKEFGPPAELMSQKGEFWSMVQSSRDLSDFEWGKQGQMPVRNSLVEVI